MFSILKNICREFNIKFSFRKLSLNDELPTSRENDTKDNCFDLESQKWNISEVDKIKILDDELELLKKERYISKQLTARENDTRDIILDDNNYHNDEWNKMNNEDKLSYLNEQLDNIKYDREYHLYYSKL